MRNLSALALVFVALFLLAPSTAEAQPEGAWDVTFELPGAPTVTFNFTSFLMFFTGTTGGPENCTWFGIELSLQGNSAAAIGALTCDELGSVSNFLGFVFNVRDRRMMDGVVLTPSVFPPFVGFTGTAQ